ncbi:PIN domain-containing protein [Thermococcus sp. SY098]|uniref:PIN domain-containing protein n=1 Tax=Thermococcus sp. SY098 TaxID=3111325 RepID=UPI002D76A37C|nr:PIN domain-containing protein [Thermococcus sp. SY098]WRS53591.1 PIN domain-containing protein [Thermococcus sp. SY098]
MHAVIDTNVLIYDTFEDLEFHTKARKLLDSLDAWYVPTIVLQEYVWFFKNNGLSVKEARSMLDEYFSDPRFRNLRENASIVKRALIMLEEEKLSLSRFNDAMILVHAIERRYSLATFDRKLRKLAERNSVKIVPEKL